jgi:hypothetical protein
MGHAKGAYWFGSRLSTPEARKLAPYNSATVLQVMDSVVIVALFLILFWFFRLCGFSRALAYGGSVAFILIELYNLNRPIHQGGSFLLVLLAIDCLLAGMERSAV